MPLLSESGDLADAWFLNVYWSRRHLGRLPVDRPIEDISIVNSLQLRNVLAQRIRHEDVIVAMIEDSIQHVDRILSLIAVEG